MAGNNLLHSVTKVVAVGKVETIPKMAFLESLANFFKLLSSGFLAASVML